MISSSSTSSSQDNISFIKEDEVPSTTSLNSPLSVESISSTNNYEKLSIKPDSPESPSSSASSLKSPDSTTSINTSNYRVCDVCGDKDADRSFGAIACDSCRGFFKRAIKNSRSYTCIATKSCSLTKKTRNHCKACRLQRCYKVGMKDEAAKDFVEREKQQKLEKKKQTKLMRDSSSAEVTSSLSDNPINCIDIKDINQAELYVDPKINNFANIAVDPIRQLCLAADKQLASLAEWAKRLPFFTTLTIEDQVKLLQWNWAELLIGGFCYRSSAVSDGILLATGLHLSRENLQKAGVGTVVNKLFGEVINKMQGLQINVSEWGCLRAIMLFAPDTKDLKEIDKVESIRGRYIATLCDHVKKNNVDDPNRLGNLLLRLPPLKAIALQVLEHLFFFKLIGDVPIDTFLLEMLDVDTH